MLIAIDAVFGSEHIRTAMTAYDCTPFEVYPTITDVLSPDVS